MESALAGIAGTVVDTESFTTTSDGLASRDPLEWPGYREALVGAASHGDESVTTGPAAVAGIDVELVAFNFAFLGGSMGEVAGERIARAFERAAERGAPVLLVTSTGGARMQEGMASLAQMPKVVVARLELAAARCPLIALLDHPTTGGVLASAAALGDITIAIGGATIGFAGPRVVGHVTGTRPLAGSHRAESALAAGLVDAVVAPEQARSCVTSALTLVAGEELRISEPPAPAPEPSGPDAWSAVLTARASDRPPAPELARTMCEESFELRGDRAGSDDRALVVWLGRLAGRRCIVLALDRERAPGPGAYRKAQRALAIAGRLRLPVVSLVDTRGADPSAPSENSGIAWLIATSLEAMLSVPVPVVAVVTGEGGSGGALALAAGDVLLAYEGSVFSVIAPEAAAEILWRTSDRGPDAARLLKPTAHELLRLGIADALLPDPPSGEGLRRAVAYHLDLLDRNGARDRLEARRQKWRNRFGP